VPIKGLKDAAFCCKQEVISNLAMHRTTVAQKKFIYKQMLHQHTPLLVNHVSDNQALQTGQGVRPRLAPGCNSPSFCHHNVMRKRGLQCRRALSVRHVRVSCRNGLSLLFTMECE